jgi:predicted DNA-binding antitoxin AbrB/MazE fold protein
VTKRLDVFIMHVYYGIGRLALMTRDLKAVYENGVLRPLESLPFGEKQIVTITVSDGADVPDDLVDTEFLADCQTLADDSVTLEQVRAALAKIPGSMAEQIICERADRV